MNKKLILGLVVAGALYYQFGRKKDEGAPVDETTIPGSPISNSTPRWLTDDEAKRYLANYEDLQIAFGNDLEKAKAHFQSWGYLENRIF